MNLDRCKIKNIILRYFGMSDYTLYGIIGFSASLYCAEDVLAKTVDISVGGHKGKLTLPSLPDWGESESDPLHKPLLPPDNAKEWKRGEKPLYWGRPLSYPSGNASVELALLEIKLNDNHLESVSQDIYKNYSSWLNLFRQYVILLTKQNTYSRVTGGDHSDHLELLINGEEGLKSIHRTNKPVITVQISDVDHALHFEHFKKAADLSSKNYSPRLEYQMLLQAYLAQEDGDYRKAIIEASSALEISITSRIMEEFQSQRISFGLKLLEKYRMLGGRFELVRVLGIPLPVKDYKKLVIGPRNDVIHKAKFPEQKIANQVITEVEELLQLFSPKIYQDK